MRIALAIDIGGTKISIAAGTDRGRILHYAEIKTRTGRQTRDCVDELMRVVEEVRRTLPPNHSKLCGIGVCLPGAVNTSRGVVPQSPNLPGWKGLPLAKMLGGRFKLPVCMVNDANAAAIGEMLFGAAKGSKNFIYVTVSTGVGGGIVINGRLLEGSSFVAGEVGHTTVVPGGDLCNCGKRGCLEAYTSGTSIERYVAKKIRETNYQALEKFRFEGRLSARELSAAARQKDPLALAAFGRAGRYLGIGLANVLNTVNPSLAVLGGGVIQSAPPLFWAELKKNLRKEAWSEALHGFRMSRTKLGSKVGNLGALAVIFEALKEN